LFFRKATSRTRSFTSRKARSVSALRLREPVLERAEHPFAAPARFRRVGRGFRWGYTWVKTQLHGAGLVERAKRRGAHRRKRERKPCEGMGERGAVLRVRVIAKLSRLITRATTTCLQSGR
jgi:hypothetical protein